MDFFTVDGTEDLHYFQMMNFGGELLLLPDQCSNKDYSVSSYS